MWYIFQLIRYSRACGSYQDLLDICLLLSRKLLNQGFLLVKLKSSFWKLYGHPHDLVDRYGISVSQMTMYMFHANTPVLSSFMTCHQICNRLTRRVPQVEQEMLIFWDHLSSTRFISGVCVTHSLVLCVCFVDRCLPFFPFSDGHCVVCSSSLNEFWLPPLHL